MKAKQGLGLFHLPDVAVNQREWPAEGALAWRGLLSASTLWPPLPKVGTTQGNSMSASVLLGRELSNLPGPIHTQTLLMVLLSGAPGRLLANSHTSSVDTRWFCDWLRETQDPS